MPTGQGTFSTGNSPAQPVGQTRQTGLKTSTILDFEKSMNQNGLPVMVDFWAPWCGPCRSMKPIVEESARETRGKALVKEINIDENPEIADMFGVEAIPTFVFFKNGKAEKKIRGSQPKEVLVSTLMGL